jgi:hypothetical protein
MKAEGVVAMNDADSAARRVGPWVHVVLAAILCLLAVNLFMLFRYGYFARLDDYSNLVVTLILLLNHIASYYTRTGWPYKVMQVVVVFLLAFGIYILWVSR